MLTLLNTETDNRILPTSFTRHPITCYQFLMTGKLLYIFWNWSFTYHVFHTDSTLSLATLQIPISRSTDRHLTQWCGTAATRAVVKSGSWSMGPALSADTPVVANAP